MVFVGDSRVAFLVSPSLDDSDGQVAVKDQPLEQSEHCVRVIYWVGGDSGPVCLSYQWLW